MDTTYQNLGEFCLVDFDKLFHLDPNLYVNTEMGLYTRMHYILPWVNRFPMSFLFFLKSNGPSWPMIIKYAVIYAVGALVYYCLLLGAWPQNIG